jgi:hypothetical protein
MRRAPPNSYLLKSETKLRERDTFYTILREVLSSTALARDARASLSSLAVSPARK